MRIWPNSCWVQWSISRPRNASAITAAHRGRRFRKVHPFQDFFDDFFGDRDGEEAPAPRSRRVNSLGSGFVIDPDGIIVTNNHVIAEADDIEVNFADGSKLVAEVVGADPKTDIAVLRVKPDEPLEAVDLGDSDSHAHW